MRWASWSWAQRILGSKAARTALGAVAAAALVAAMSFVALPSPAAASDLRLSAMGGLDWIVPDESEVFFSPAGIYTFSGTPVLFGDIRLANTTVTDRSSGQSFSNTDYTLDGRLALPSSSAFPGMILAGVGTADGQDSWLGGGLVAKLSPTLAAGGQVGYQAYRSGAVEGSDLTLSPVLAFRFPASRAVAGIGWVATAQRTEGANGTSWNNTLVGMARRVLADNRVVTAAVGYGLTDSTLGVTAGLSQAAPNGSIWGLGGSLRSSSSGWTVTGKAGVEAAVVRHLVVRGGYQLAVDRTAVGATSFTSIHGTPSVGLGLRAGGLQLDMDVSDYQPIWQSENASVRTTELSVNTALTYHF